VFAFVLMLSGIKLVELPGATTIIEVSIVLLTIGTIVWSVRQVQQRRIAVEGPA
jgi:hypothetical protein